MNEITARAIGYLAVIILILGIICAVSWVDIWFLAASAALAAVLGLVSYWEVRKARKDRRWHIDISMPIRTYAPTRAILYG